MLDFSFLNNLIQPITMDTNLPNTILQETISWCAAIGAIVLVVFIVKDVYQLVKGEASIGKLLIKIFCVFILIGVMFAAGSFETLGNIFKNVFEKVVTEDNLPNIGQK